jgi:cell division septation protein DedD
MIAVCSGASYLTGKAMSVREESALPVIQLEQPPAAAAPVIEATIAPVPVAQLQSPIASPVTPKPAAEVPLFARTVPQAIYIQVGAVEKGVATVIAEGLRKHALDSFVAPGPTEKTFRVLIGPFPNAEAYQKAQNVVDQIGLASFARRYQAQ